MRTVKKNPVIVNTMRMVTRQDTFWTALVNFFSLPNECFKNSNFHRRKSNLKIKVDTQFTDTHAE